MPQQPSRSRRIRVKAVDLRPRLIVLFVCTAVVMVFAGSADGQQKNPVAAKKADVEAAPISIRALAPGTEDADEFALPPGASPNLVKHRNRIDSINGQLDQIAESIDNLLLRQEFEQAPSAPDIEALKQAQKRYQEQLQRLQEVQESFRRQMVTDNDLKVPADAATKTHSH